MKQYPLPNKKACRVIALICSLSFWMFSMVYLAMFQGNLLSLRADSLFLGNLSYNPWLGAAIITFLFWLLQRLMVKWITFGIKEYAFSFIPSFALLGVITYHPQNYTIPLAVCLFSGAMLLSLVLFFLWGRNSAKPSMMNLVNFNLQELLLLCCLTIAVGNTDEDLHHELSMSKAIEQGNYMEVLQIGKKTLSVSPKMADYRIRAMIATDQIGTLLFDYPQYYDSLPILFQKDTVRYELSGLHMARKLLTKDLHGVCDQLNKENIQNPKKNYAEAVILYKYLHPDSTLNVMDDENTIDRFKAFIDLRALLTTEGTKPIVAKNKMRREFGSTYWFYYYYSEK